MKEKSVPFVLKSGFGGFSQTLLYDFYMFVILVVYYIVCLTLGPIAVFLDYSFKTKKFYPKLKQFFYFVANL